MPRRAKPAPEEKFTLSEIVFVIQFWHQRDRAWGQMVTEEELIAAGISLRLRRKMLRTWGTWDDILTPGHFRLDPGDHGIGAPKNSRRVRSREIKTISSTS